MGASCSSPASWCKRSKVDKRLLEIRTFSQWLGVRTRLVEMDPPTVLVRSILLLTDDKCDPHLQEHPIVDKVLHLDDVQSFEYGILDLVGIGHGFLGNVSFCISSSIG